jgi:hypothetical protein
MTIATLAERGKPRSALATDPAAGSEASLTVPTGEKWILLGASVPLVQGATQTPLGYLTIKDASGTTVAQFAGATAATSVSTTTRYNWFPGATITAGAGATVNQAMIPSGLVVKGGWTISTTTTGIGANTDYGVLAVWVLAY